MADSALRFPRTEHLEFSQRVSRHKNIQVQHHWRYSFVIALVSLSLAILLVPEKPNELASICEKHNSVIACSVW